MSRLYSVLPENTSSPEDQASVSELDQSTDDVAVMVDEMSAYMETQTDKTTTAMEYLAVGVGIQTSMESLPVGSKEYYSALSASTSVIEILGRRMGVNPMPAMEDFKSQYAMRSSHQIAMEGIGDFLKKAWESLKKFFVEFFKKVTVFFKRILRANLDLQSYEKYTDHLINKLKTNNAKISDTTPVNTKIGKLLADKGMESVTSDFILRNGTLKVVQMVNLLGAVSKPNGSLFDRNSIKNIRETLEQLVTLYNSSGYGDRYTAGIDTTVQNVRDAVTATVSGLFKHTVPDSRNLPDDCYAKLMEEISTSDLSKDKLELFSLVSTDKLSNTLPKDLNVFLGIIDNEKFFVSSHKDEHDVTVANVKPIAQLNNLVELHNFYKKEVMPVNLTQISKSIEGVDDEVNKILNLLATKWIKVVEKSKEEVFSKEPDWDKLWESVRGYSRKQLDARVQEFQQEFSNKGKLSKEENDFYYAAVSLASGMLENNRMAWVIAVEEPVGKDESPAGVTRRTLAAKMVFTWAGLTYPDDTNDSSEAPSEENWKKFEDLNRFLVHAFNRMQNILHAMLGDVFGMFTEIRYELVRYMYESARRYSY